MPLDVVGNPQTLMEYFTDPDLVARYAEGVRRFVPGVDALHKMTSVLLAETAPPDGRVLVLGAGGGMEARALAEAHPGWSIVGVDPSSEMLCQASRMLGAKIGQVTFIEGYIEDAPAGPFDAAVCLLTLHFLNASERIATVREIHRRLRVGAPFVAAHASFPQTAGERSRWLGRYAAYAIASGAATEDAEAARSRVEVKLPALSPEEDAAIISAGGFRNVELFYAAFTWRGWIACA